MKQYQLVFRPHAERSFGVLPQDVKQRLTHVLLELSNNPRPPGVKKMRGFKIRWRIREGDYRVLYEIHDDRLIVLVLEIDHRRNIYRR